MAYRNAPAPMEGKKEGKAVKAIRALRSQLTEMNPAFSGAVALEDAAERFCREVRENLRDQRKAHGLDQSAVAEILDMTQSAVSKIESGEGDIGMKTVFRYANALGLIPVFTLMEDGSLLLPAEATHAAEAVRSFQTSVVKETSQAASSAAASLARSIGKEEA
jgi:transcriptional regulator with XRE-family HTH domain